MVNIVSLKNWSSWPICCPFCGKPEFDLEAAWPDVDESNSCRHLLYVYAEGEYIYQSTRYRASGGNDSEFINCICFESDNVSDVSRTSFAPVGAELDLWGNDSQISPFLVPQDE